MGFGSSPAGRSVAAAERGTGHGFDAAAWQALEKELEGAGLTSLEVDASGLDSCDSAGLALLYVICAGRMTPGAAVRLTGLGPELKDLFDSYSMDDLKALEAHRPTCRAFPEEVGTATWSLWLDLRQQVEFIGEVTVNLAKSLAGPAADAVAGSFSRVRIGGG